MSDEEIIDGIVKGEIPFRRVEEHTDGDSERATRIRRRAVEIMTGSALDNVGYYSIDAQRSMKAHIENMIGVVQIPMGIVGPIYVRGDYADGEYYVPMSTTEGALIASVSRGCSAIARAGYAKATVFRDGMTRGPVLMAPDAAVATDAADFVVEKFDEIKDIAEETDPFITLLRIDPYVVGRNIFLRFVYDTGDAMGMNMCTIATDESLRFIENQFPSIAHVALSGNMCIDKKPSALNLIEGRGKSVVCDIVLPRDVVEDVFKTTPEAVVDVCYRKCLIGSAQAGSYSFNAHFANMIAAIYLATGQDEAHVVEGSSGFTLAELTDERDLYFSVTIPSLQVGTIGGGTNVETQQEALSIIGVHGAGNPPGSNAKKFAEIISAVVLAGELSLIGAIGARHLSEAHIRLNR